MNPTRDKQDKEMVLTFDLGTTRLKVAAFDLKGVLLGQVAIRNTDYSEDNLRWQNSEEWWQNCITGVSELISIHQLDLNKLRGISLSGRAGSCVFLDSDGQVIANPWSDNRHNPQLQALLQENLHANLQDKLPLYAASIMAKYLWMRSNQPETARNTRHLLYAKDFLLYKLCGKFVTDPASSADSLQWQSGILKKHNIDESLLPEIQLPWTIAGTTHATSASALNCPVNIPVAVGGHDGICANTGAGAIDENQFTITLGTHSVVRAIAMNQPENSLRFYGYPPDKHVIGGNALMAGRSLDWFVDNWFSISEDERQQTFAKLDQAASLIPPGSRGIKFLPYLSGQLAPEKSTDARATFYGLGINHNRDDMFRAVLEGSGFALCRIFNQVINWVGEPVSIGVTGSGVLSRTLTQIIADVLQRPLSITDASSEGRGAAMFCTVALGIHENINDAAGTMIIENDKVEPNTDLSTTYANLLDEWVHFSRAIRNLEA